MCSPTSPCSIGTSPSQLGLRVVCMFTAGATTGREGTTTGSGAQVFSGAVADPGADPGAAEFTTGPVAVGVIVTAVAVGISDFGGVSGEGAGCGLGTAIGPGGGFGAAAGSNPGFNSAACAAAGKDAGFAAGFTSFGETCVVSPSVGSTGRSAATTSRACAGVVGGRGGVARARLLLLRLGPESVWAAELRFPQRLWAPAVLLQLSLQ